MRIDVHAHYWTDEYLDLLAGFGKPDTATQRGLGAGGGAELAARLTLMDRAGVDMQILSASPQLPHFDEEAHAVRAARLVNDEYAAVTAAHPDRFRAFAALPLPHVDASLAELARAMDELGMLGATITTSILGRSPADAAWAPIFAELDRRGAALYVHPAGCGAGSPLISPYHLTWMIGAPIEDTVAILHFITHGIPSRYSRMKIIASHLGGALPMVLQRLDDHYRWEAPDTPERPSLAARRMWYDTVAHTHAPALRCACESLGADRLVLGTDFPYEAGDRFLKAVSYVGASLDAADARKILDENAAALLGLGATARTPARAGR